MSFRYFPIALACLGLLIPVVATAADLEVTVTGITGTTGDVRVIVITDPEGMARQDRSQNVKVSTAKDGALTARFLGLSPGRYGVIATQDVHVNHALEKAVTGKVAAASSTSEVARVTVAEPTAAVTLTLR